MTKKSHAGAAAKENGSGQLLPGKPMGSHGVNSSPSERQLASARLKAIPAHPFN